MSAPWPWFRFYHSEYQLQTRGMRSSEKGIYLDLLVVMHEWGEPIPEDVPMLARATSTTTTAFKAAFETLLARGVIFRTDDGKLWSAASQRQKENQEKKSERGRENSSQRWGKSKENQQQDDATAYRYKTQDKDRDFDPPQEDQKSSSYRDSKQPNSTVENDAARDGAAPPKLRANDRINIPDIGHGTVKKILSRQPYCVLASHPKTSDGGEWCLMRWNGRGFDVMKISDAKAREVSARYGDEDDHATRFS